MAGSTLPPDLSLSAPSATTDEGHGYTNDGSLFPDAPTEPPFASLGPGTAPKEVDGDEHDEENGPGVVPKPVFADPDVFDPASMPHSPASTLAPAVFVLEPALPASSSDVEAEGSKAVPMSVKRALELDGGGSGTSSGLGSGLFTPAGDGVGSPAESDVDGKVEPVEEEMVVELDEAATPGPGPSSLGTAPVIMASESGVVEEGEGADVGEDVGAGVEEEVEQEIVEVPAEDAAEPPASGFPKETAEHVRPLVSEPVLPDVDEEQERPLLSVDTDMPSSAAIEGSSTTSDLELSYPADAVSATSMTFTSAANGNGTYANSSSSLAVADALEEEYGDEDAEGESDVDVGDGGDVMVFDLNGVPVSTPTVERQVGILIQYFLILTDSTPLSSSVPAVVRAEGNESSQVLDGDVIQESVPEPKGAASENDAVAEQT